MLKELRGKPTLPISSCVRFGHGDHAARHDGRAHVPFFSDDNVHSRTAGAIWFLTREWCNEEGGHVLDFHDKQGNPSKILPVYNSLVVFEVPHEHAISKILAQRHLYAISGWWHQKGEYYTVPESTSDAMARKKKGLKKKLKKKAVSA